MGLFNFIDPLINVLFSPLLLLPPWLSIFLLALLVSIIVVISMKIMTDKDVIKRLKDEMKELQKEMKEVKEDPEKAMSVNKRLMETNMKYMGMSMKSNLLAFIPIIIIFGWLSSNLAFMPLLPNMPFNLTISGENNVVLEPLPVGLNLINGPGNYDDKLFWTLSGNRGLYTIELSGDGQLYSKDILITDKHKYIHPLKHKSSFIDAIYSSSKEGFLPDGSVSTIEVSNNYVRPFGNFRIFGWRPGWLGTYIIFSIVLSILMRKIFDL